jgi:hypothetical protein
LHNVELVMCCLVAYLLVFILSEWVIRNKADGKREKQRQVEAPPTEDVVLVEEEVAA